MNFYKEKLSPGGRWQIATICFSLIYGQAYAEPLTLDTALKLAEQYAPTLRINSAQIEGAENMVSANAQTEILRIELRQKVASVWLRCTLTGFC